MALGNEYCASEPKLLKIKVWYTDLKPTLLKISLVIICLSASFLGGNLKYPRCSITFSREPSSSWKFCLRLLNRPSRIASISGSLLIQFWIVLKLIDNSLDASFAASCLDCPGFSCISFLMYSSIANFCSLFHLFLILLFCIGPLVSFISEGGFFCACKDMMALRNISWISFYTLSFCLF